MDDEIERCPATSAVTFLRDIELNTTPSWLPKLFLLLWTRSENRTTLEVRTHTSAPSSRRLCLALHRFAPPVQLPPKHRKSMSACRSEKSVIAYSDGDRPS